MPTTLLRLRSTALAFLARLDFLPGLLARILLGLTFIPSGWAKLHDLEQFTDFFQSLGIPFPGFQAPFVACVELVCGALVLVGAATRLAALPLIGTMVVAILTAVWPQVSGITELVTKIEPLYIGLLVQLVFFGPGAVSLDALFLRRFAADGAERPAAWPRAAADR